MSHTKLTNLARRILGPDATVKRTGHHYEVTTGSTKIYRNTAVNIVRILHEIETARRYRNDGHLFSARTRADYGVSGPGEGY